MNLVMRGINPSNIKVRRGDTLANDWPYFDDNDKEKSYRYVPVDCVVSNPPYSHKWDADNYTNDPRYKEYGIAPDSKADYAFLLHDLYHLKERHYVYCNAARRFVQGWFRKRHPHSVGRKQ